MLLANLSNVQCIPHFWMQAARQHKCIWQPAGALAICDRETKVSCIVERSTYNYISGIDKKLEHLAKYTLKF